MKLTGKIREDFTKWLYAEYTEYNVLQLSKFDVWPMDSQWGFFQSFADSVDYDLVSFRWHNKISAMIYENNYKGLFDKDVYTNDKSKNRNQARERIMNKFIEIYNEKS